nr:GTPase [Aeromicrobium stalagmiti]
MGRTMSGKSTLFEFLSGGDGARIGVGGQRTTRESCSRAVQGLAIDVVDTPGVGAMDGEDDYARAFEEVAGADLILWVATDQATQEQTGRALERLSDLGKPILVALNCLADVSDELGLEDMLYEPDQVFGGDATGNLVPVQRHLARAGGQYICALQVHAQAALLSTSGLLEPDVAHVLRSNSRIDTLLESLRHQQEQTAAQRRVVSAFDAPRIDLLEAATSSNTQVSELRSAAASYQGTRTSLRKRAHRRIDDACDEIQSATTNAISRRERWIEQVDPDLGLDQINKKWNHELKGLRNELEDAINEIGLRLRADLNIIAYDVAADWAHVDSDGFAGLGGRGEIWGNRVVKVGGRMAAGVGGLAAGAKVGSLVGTLFGPGPGTAIGTGVGALIGLTGSLLGVDRAIDWLGDQLFRSPSKVRERRRKKISKQLSPLLVQLKAEVDKIRTKVQQDWFDAVESDHERRLAREEALDLAIGCLETATRELESAVANLDTELCRELLRMNGFTRVASAVSRADRWRGAGIAVALPEAEFAEVVLYPATGGVERIVPTRSTGRPESNALQVLRCMTTAPLTVESMSERRLVVDLSKPAPGGTREAWVALAQIHSGANVTIRERPLEGEPDVHDSHP